MPTVRLTGQKTSLTYFCEQHGGAKTFIDRQQRAARVRYRRQGGNVTNVGQRVGGGFGK
jgi:hypothetical protein